MNKLIDLEHIEPKPKTEKPKPEPEKTPLKLHIVNVTIMRDRENEGNYKVKYMLSFGTKFVQKEIEGRDIAALLADTFFKIDDELRGALGGDYGLDKDQ